MADKPAGARLFPENRNTATLIRADMKTAGIDATHVAFHSLRHSFISWVVMRSGASPKQSQALARHSKPELTFNRYTHVQTADLASAADALPALVDKGRLAHGERLTGTYPQSFAHVLPAPPVSKCPAPSRSTPKKMGPSETQKVPESPVREYARQDLNL